MTRARERGRERERERENEERLTKLITQSKMSGWQQESHHPHPPPFDWCVNTHHSASYFDSIQDFSLELYIHVHSASRGDQRGLTQIIKKQILKKRKKTRSVRHSFHSQKQHVCKCICVSVCARVCVDFFASSKCHKTWLRSSSRPRTAIKTADCRTPWEKPEGFRSTIYTNHFVSSLTSKPSLPAQLCSPSSSQHPSPPLL